MTQEQTLLPCPFCGGKAEILQSGKQAAEVKCTVCRIGIEQKVLRNSVDWLKEKLAAKWNSRVRQLSAQQTELGWVHRFNNEEEFLQFLKWRREASAQSAVDLPTVLDDNPFGDNEKSRSFDI